MRCRAAGLLLLLLIQLGADAKLTVGTYAWTVASVRAVALEPCLQTPRPACCRPRRRTSGSLRSPCQQRAAAALASRMGLAWRSGLRLWPSWVPAAARWRGRTGWRTARSSPVFRTGDKALRWDKLNGKLMYACGALAAPSTRDVYGAGQRLLRAEGLGGGGGGGRHSHSHSHGNGNGPGSGRLPREEAGSGGGGGGRRLQQLVQADLSDPAPGSYNTSASGVLLLHSRPSATRKIYLDFDGHTTRCVWLVSLRGGGGMHGGSARRSIGAACHATQLRGPRAQAARPCPPLMERSQQRRQSAPAGGRRCSLGMPACQVAWGVPV
jgi:hypothetical protein